MFGNNPSRSVVNTPLDLYIEEHFYTIQGEGPLSGSPCIFIRLAGCNLACWFCDTQFERNAERATGLVDLCDQLAKAYSYEQRRLVVITGGEPLRQNITALVEALLKTGTEQVQIETAGSMWVEELEWLLMSQKVILVCSPKTPSVKPGIITYCRHWKYVVQAEGVDPLDGLPNRGTQTVTKDLFQRIYRAKPRERGNANTIWVSPCDEYDPAKNKANQDTARDVCLKFGYRLSLQIHKIVGVA